MIASGTSEQVSCVAPQRSAFPQHEVSIIPAKVSEGAMMGGRVVAELVA